MGGAKSETGESVSRVLEKATEKALLSPRCWLSVFAQVRQALQGFHDLEIAQIQHKTAELEA